MIHYSFSVTVLFRFSSKPVMGYMGTWNEILEMLVPEHPTL